MEANPMNIQAIVSIRHHYIIIQSIYIYMYTYLYIGLLLLIDRYEQPA